MLESSSQVDKLYASDLKTKTQINHWLNWSTGQLTNDLSKSMIYLEQSIADFLFGGKLTAADYAVYGSLFKSS